MKLSEIKEELLTDGQRDTLIFRGLKFTGESAETALLLGTNAHAAGRAVGAAQLYCKGLVRKIISSGNPDWDFPEGRFSEAEYMKFVMMREGVPEDAIILENQALSTLQNMTYSLDIIKNKPELIKDNKLILVTSGYHMYRSLLLAQKVFSGIRIIPCPVWEKDIRPENWMDTENGRARVRTEVHFLLKHAVDGYIDDVESPFDKC